MKEEHNHCHSNHSEESHCHCHEEDEDEKHHCRCHENGEECHCHEHQHCHSDEHNSHTEHNHCHCEHSEESHCHNHECHCTHEDDEKCTCGDDCHCHEHHHHGENCTCNACRGESDEFKINTYVYFRRNPFNREKFEKFMEEDFGRKIIRTKGMVYFEDEKDNLYIYEQAGKQKVLENNGLFYAALPEEQLNFAKQDPKFMEIWDDNYGDRMIKLVFIGQNLNKNEIKARLDMI